MFPWKRAIIERGLKLLTQRLNYSQREKDVGDFVTVEYQYTLILNVCSVHVVAAIKHLLNQP